MNLIEFWKEYVKERNHYSQYDENELKDLLESSVDNWRADAHNRSLWKYFHCYGSNINETIVLNAILKEVGVELAIFIYNNFAPYRQVRERSCALTVCADNLATNWDKYSDVIKLDLIEFENYKFIQICKTNFWEHLEDKYKVYVVTSAISKEKDYIRDLISLQLLQTNFRYLYLMTSHAKMRAQHLEELGHELRGYDIPGIQEVHGYLEYHPSNKLQVIGDIISSANDPNLQEIFKRSQRDIEHIIDSVNHI